MRKRPVAADSAAAHADDLFRSRLENQIDLRHPLAKLAAGCRGQTWKMRWHRPCRPTPSAAAVRHCRCG